MKTSAPLKVFIQEDDREMQKKIARDLKDYNYTISFFSKGDSAFDLLMFNPDILIQDYQTNKVVKCYEWEVPYNQWQ
jgi:DNA-binding response OmpR family regulator